MARQKRFMNVESAKSSAKLGMTLGLVGVPIVCAPLSIVGAVLGVRALRLAKAEGTAAPAPAFVAIGAGFLSTALFVLAIVLSQMDARAKQEHHDAIVARLAGKREAPTLDAKVACDLVEERLNEDGFGGETSPPTEVHCDGALDQKSGRAAMPSVHAFFGAKHFTLMACFSRAPAWFVLAMVDSGDCNVAPAPGAPPTPPTTEADKRALEKRLREDYAKVEERSTVQTFLDRLARVRDAAPKPQDLKEADCGGADIKHRLPPDTDRLKVPTVDFDDLDRSRATPQAGARWSWLTSDGVRTMLSGDADAGPKLGALKDLRAEGGGLLLVYRASEKHWPEVREKDALLGTKVSFVGGEYDGWMIVFDYESGERLCQTRLGFESGDDVEYDKNGVDSKKERAARAVDDDFKDQFETAATKAMKRLGPGLRLGYKILE